MRDVWVTAIIGATLVALAWIASKRKRKRHFRIVIEYDEQPKPTEDQQ